MQQLWFVFLIYMQPEKRLRKLRGWGRDGYTLGEQTHMVGALLIGNPTAACPARLSGCAP